MTEAVYVETQGCQMNEYDADRMVDVLVSEAGFRRVDAPEQADLLLLNTCSVREKAQEKVFSQLGRWRRLKDRAPETLIGVGGCVASQEGDAILRRAPYVDLVFGPQTLHRLPEMVARRRAGGGPQVDVAFPEIEKFDRLPEPRATGPTAYVSVMEGCSKYCSFCVVPYTRGEEISRPVADVLAEVEALAAQGVREVTLLGQNVNAYAGRLRDGSAGDLGLLIEAVAAVPGIDRIRFTTSHPAEFHAGLVEAYREVPELADFLHLPVQAGSDLLLRLMKRGHDTAAYEALVAELRAARPSLALATDLIVGFPGETEEHFTETMALIDRVGFDAGAFSFIYSPRPGTPAAALHDPTPQAAKRERLHRLQARIAEQQAAAAQRLLGTVQSVLVEGVSRRSAAELRGRTSCNRVVNFPGDPALVGRFAEVRISGVRTHSLRGELEAVEQPAAAGAAATGA
ncbi:tRNA (N6-isopentenyl adenosine(37)-C2)-methylthiotransferase MiaB [Halorhodospira neutriphila]|uniref:tRNA-2-methylthio-N(6)-dimethylallyladenosine synthase n=1 Tax=Halorhodospira neutriphila TaxID=168379 RepID=A0ABS1E2L9_9GAMM|nr:tRNA (N6-isopentenyl adenosine(37)-C2)-methylthiotransferase MiaB [Halorhodospira neutriphila]